MVHYIPIPKKISSQRRMNIIFNILPHSKTYADCQKTLKRRPLSFTFEDKKAAKAFSKGLFSYKRSTFNNFCTWRDIERNCVKLDVNAFWPRANSSVSFTNQKILYGQLIGNNFFSSFLANLWRKQLLPMSCP